MAVVALALSQINSFFSLPSGGWPGVDLWFRDESGTYYPKSDFWVYTHERICKMGFYKKRHPKPETGQGRYPIHHYNKRRFHKYGVFCVLGPAENWLAWLCESCFFRPASITAAAAWTTFKEEYYCSSSISLYILSI